MTFRVRLLILTLLLLLPAIILLVVTAEEQRKSAENEARESAVRLAALVSSNQAQLIDVTRQLLIAVAALPDVRQRRAAGCSALVGNLVAQYPRYANLGAASPEGKVFCSAIPMSHAVSAADRVFFQRALSTREFAAGDYVVGRITGKPSLIFGYPSLNESGEVLAVVFAALDLEWLNHLVAESDLPPGSVVTVVDGKGLVLSRVPSAPNAIGQPVEPAIARLLRGSPEVRTAEAPGPNGKPYLYAFAALGGRVGAVAHVVIGVSKAAAFAEADRLLRRNLMLLVGMALVTLALAWYGGEIVILRRVRPLVAATRRLAAGDLTVRSGIGHRPGELGELARAFDQMAESLQRAEEAHRQEEALRRKNYELEQQNLAVQEADRMKTEFVAMVSHELRTPLTSIHGHVELLLDRAALSDDARESLGVVRNNADRLLALINDLLDLSRMEAGKITLRRRAIDVVPTIHAVVGSLQPLIQSKRQRLTLEMADGLPPVWADPDRVVQILINLVSNAHKYTPVEGAITVRARAADGFVSVAVHDTGVGLTSEQQSQLFTRFFRVRQPGVRTAPGTGLGLVITRLLVELHGGEIVVASTPGEGSTFTFSLPVLHSGGPRSGQEIIA